MEPVRLINYFCYKQEAPMGLLMGKQADSMGVSCL